MTIKKVGDQAIGVIRRRRIDNEGNISRFQEYHTLDEKEEELSEHPPYNKYGFVDHPQLQMEKNEVCTLPITTTRRQYECQARKVEMLLMQSRGKTQGIANDGFFVPSNRLESVEGRFLESFNVVVDLLDTLNHFQEFGNIRGMLRATQPATIQAAILTAGILTDEAVRSGTLAKAGEKRKEKDEVSNSESDGKDEKKVKGGRGFVAVVPPRRENGNFPKILLYDENIVCKRRRFNIPIDIDTNKDKEVMDVIVGMDWLSNQKSAPSKVAISTSAFEDARTVGATSRVARQGIYSAKSLTMGSANEGDHENHVDIDLDLLRHVVNHDGIHVDPSKIEAVKSWKALTTPSEIGLKLLEDHQKRYVDNRRKPIEFQVGNHVMLKVSPWKGVVEIPKELSSVHNTFQVSNIKKCLTDAKLHVLLDEIKVDKTLRFVEESLEIMDREVKTLKRSKIPIVKVR
ncbi:hypothetical protein Tco_0340407 [Tanacetum coccineum]